MIRHVALFAVALTVNASTVTLSDGAGSCTYTGGWIDDKGNITFQCVKTCEERVTALYRDILYREPDVGGFEFWVGQCKAGVTEQHMRDFFEPFRPKVKP